MKRVSESKALEELNSLKENYKTFINVNFEHKAKSCLTCETKGACCLDAHFVNVHITRLESVAMQKSLAKLGEKKSRIIYERAKQTVEKYDLKNSGDTFAQTFACPLFEKGVGCLVHSDAKPAPCISHACYENKEDLPPEKFQDETEQCIARLNNKTYNNAWSWLPIPIWLGLMNPFTKRHFTDRNET